MKPDWRYSPEWAKWVAKDINGVWWWYETRPLLNTIGSVWLPVYGTKTAIAMKTGPNPDGWEHSLEEEPE